MLVAAQLSCQFRGAIVESEFFVVHNDDGRHCFAEVSVRYSDHRRFLYPGNFIEHEFDFFGIDVLAAADNQVTGSALQGQAATFVEATEIAGCEPSVIVEGNGGDVVSVQ